MKVKHIFLTLTILLTFLIPSFAQAQQHERSIVRLIYFLPSDRQPQPNIDAKMDRLIKDVQYIFAEVMEGHGFGRKTFQFETDANGSAVVHHIKGQFTDKHYRNLPYTWDVWEEIDRHLDTTENIWLTVIDISTKALNQGNAGGLGGITNASGAGRALIPASAVVDSGIVLIAHELAHAFGLQHDSRGDVKWIQTPISDWMVTSFCAAEWLDVHRAFTPSHVTANEWATDKMLSVSLASPPNAIRLRFEVTDPDGIHQVQLLSRGNLLGCKRLNGNLSGTVEFVTRGLKPVDQSVSLQIIDVQGNLSWTGNYPVDITSLLPPPEVVSIPDANLAAAVREKIGDSITTHTMLNFKHLVARDRGITALTGLEHAHCLIFLDLSGNNISDIAPLTNLTPLTSLDLSGNNISDITPLSQLSQLSHLASLYLENNNISDVTSLSQLSQLTYLHLENNNISDITPLSQLSHLASLELENNNISDITSLSQLSQLTYLHLENNNISDIAPLSQLTQLRDLSLGGNNISDITPLSQLIQLRQLYLYHNSISDITPLSQLTDLGDLWLLGNNISDITPLSQLIQLTNLTLSNNAISDITPLVELDLTGVEWDNTGLDIWGNPLSYASIHTHIPAMQARGIEVKFDPRTPTSLVKISGDTQQGTVNAVLPLPFVVEVRDQQKQAFAGVPVTFSVLTGNGQLSTTTTATDTNGRASTHLTLGRTAGTATVRVTAAEISKDVQFTAKAELLSTPVTLPDSALHAEIARTLNKPQGAVLTAADMLTLTTLTANSANIRDLTGLQHARHLKTLSLDNNDISEVGTLAGLPQLTRLSLDANNLSSVAPLEGLTALETLSLADNSISDITPLMPLNRLETLSLADNSISDITPLMPLNRLETLSLSNNTISNTAPLETLTKLKTLQLSGNLLSYPSLHTSVPAIQANGTTVTFSSRTPSTILKISGVRGVAGAAHPIIIEVQDENGFGFPGVPVTFTITAGGGHLSPSNVITDNTGSARTTLTLGEIPGKNTLSVVPAEVQHPAVFNMTAIRANSPVVVRDANLRAKIAETLGTSAGVQLTAGDMLRLTSLDAVEANIQNLTGLEHAHSLTILYLRGNSISDITPLSQLTDLAYLFLSDSNISDITPLSQLTQLTQLDISNNAISDITPLSQLTQLTRLDISNNAISDITPLSQLTHLTDLRLYGNGISDITPLSQLTDLAYLFLDSNNISDITPLSQLTQLTWLYLGGNNISDITPLSQLTQLTRLFLDSNNISDITPLSQLTDLAYLFLGGNNISDITPLSQLTDLAYLFLGGNNISDITPLSQLTQLTQLHLYGNNISDITPLSQLTQLTQLHLYGNNISDIAPLVELDLTGTEWDSTGLDIRWNPLSYASIHTHIPAMQAKGVEVKFDGTPHAALTKISGDMQAGEAEATLTTPLRVEAIDAHGTPMAGLSVNFHITQGNGNLRQTTVTADANGRAQTTLTLGDPGVIKVRVTATGITYPVTFTATVTEASRLVADVNRDGVVNIQDMVLVSSNFGQTGQNAADVNGDDVVNIADLVLVAGAFGEGAAAAPTLHLSDLKRFTAEEVQRLLTQARQLARTDPAYLRGVAVLEQLLARLLPEETALLPNYPNPFNPETWIPYQLSAPAEVTLHIYAVDGKLVRTLKLGHQPAGMYQTRSRTAYWDGRNQMGEKVASGVYFYTLTAGDFTATRKMFIRK